MITAKPNAKPLHVKMSFHSLASKTNFRIKGFAPDLALKRGQKTARWLGLKSIIPKQNIIWELCHVSNLHACCDSVLALSLSVLTLCFNTVVFL